MSAAASLFVDPITHHFDRDQLFEVGASGFTRDDAPVWQYFRDWFAERDIAVHTADLLGTQRRNERVAYISFGNRGRYRSLVARDDVILSGFFTRECPVVEPSIYRELPAVSEAFRRVFSFSTTEALLPFTGAPVPVHPFRLSQPYEGVHPEAWAKDDRRFLVLVSTNKLPRIDLNELYRERLRAVEHFHRHEEIDVYGVGWDEPPFRMGETNIPGTVRRVARAGYVRWHRLRPTRDATRIAASEAWRGPTRANVETLSGYTFALCFENMKLEGWVTERIFDTLAAGTVPVYLGAPDIERWVPRECFVDMRDFASYEELRAFLHSLSPSQIAACREAGREYFASAKYRPFTKEALAELVGSIVAQDAEVVL